MTAALASAPGAAALGALASATRTALSRNLAPNRRGDRRKSYRAHPLQMCAETEVVHAPSKDRDCSDSVRMNCMRISRRIIGVFGWGTMGALISPLTLSTPGTAKRVFSAIASDDSTSVASGLQIFDKKVGSGASPQNGDLVVLNYVGKLENGEVFDSTRARNKPIAFVYGGRPFAGVCKGMLQGIQGMKPGGQRVLVVPPDLGFGKQEQVIKQATFNGVFCDKGPPPPDVIVPANAVLTYEIELIKVNKIPAQMQR